MFFPYVVTISELPSSHRVLNSLQTEVSYTAVQKYCYPPRAVHTAELLTCKSSLLVKGLAVFWAPRRLTEAQGTVIFFLKQMFDNCNNFISCRLTFNYSCVMSLCTSSFLPGGRYPTEKCSWHRIVRWSLSYTGYISLVY